VGRLDFEGHPVVDASSAPLGRGRNQACLEARLNYFKIMQEFAAQYQVSRGGKNLGAYDLAAIRQMVSSGMLTPDDLVWTQGMPAWLPISAVLPDLPAGAAPELPPTGGISERDRLRVIASNHRALNFLFLGTLVLPCLFGGFIGEIGNGTEPRAASWVIGLISIAFIVVAFVGLVYLCIKVYKLAEALKTSLPPIVCVLGIFCLGYVNLLILSVLANSALKQAGVKVGFMGADPDSIR